MDQLEYGEFNIHGRQSIEQHKLSQFEQSKHVF